MRSVLSFALPLALAGSALANPLMRRDDACLAAVTGKAALGDDSLRQSHCASFIKTIVTPAATTVTVTITGAPSAAAWSKREVDERDVTVCPNEVPNYASACDEVAYKSACSVWGITGETTFTIPAATSTVWYAVDAGLHGGPGGICTSTAVITSTVSACSGGTTTVTSTTTKTSVTVVYTTEVTTTVGTATTTVTVASIKVVGANSTATTTVTSTATIATTTTSVSTTTVTPDAVTVTVTTTPSTVSVPTGGNCLDATQAQKFVDAFTDLLEYTSYNGTAAPPGRGYHYNVSATYLAVDFQDYSDSINWMAGFPLGGVTFSNRSSFDYGQGILQPELKMTTLNVDFGCKTVHWRWSALTSSYANVRGINYMTITNDLTQIQTNFAEFDNADWIQSFAPYAPPTAPISCVVPGGLTTAAKRSLPHSY